jgi:hypothetical protein
VQEFTAEDAASVLSGKSPEPAMVQIEGA